MLKLYFCVRNVVVRSIFAEVSADDATLHYNTLQEIDFGLGNWCSLVTGE